MARVGLKWIAPRRNPFLVGPYIDEVAEAVVELGEDMKADFDDVVSDWTTRVTFRKFVKVEAGGVSVRVGPASNAKIWHWVDKGTRPHMIRPKNPRGRLRFQTGYSARTQPGQAHAGSGTASGDVVHSAGVQHPGTAPRGFTVDIHERYKDELGIVVREAIRDAKRG